MNKDRERSNTYKGISILLGYKKLFEEGLPVEKIMKVEKIAHRTVYKYLNLAYLSLVIINHIMDGKEEV